MNHASRSKTRAHSRSFAIILTTVAFALVASALMVSNSASAATGPKQVKGYIWDNAGRLVEGADVTINMLAQSDLSIRASYSETTPSDGYYSVSFGMSEWDIGDTIQVIATFNGNQEPNSTAATSTFSQWVNVSFDFEIPEFGGYLGLLIAGGAIGVVGIAVVSMKRRR
jgi:hypothetical protein